MADRNESPEGVTMKVTVNGEGGATLSKSAPEVCLDWIYSVQSEIEKASYGNNKESVAIALKLEEQRAERIQNYSDALDHAINKASTEEAENMRSAYDKLKAVSDKKISCLKTMQNVASLQELCVNLSKKVDMKAVSLVDLGEKDVSESGDGNLFGFMAASAQDCVFATRDNWDWNLKLVKCIGIHMKNASDYHQFFHEVEESSVWLLKDIQRIHDSYTLSPLKGDYTDAQRLLEEIKDVTTALRQWEMKTDFLWEKGMKVVPVYKRTTAQTETNPARAIVDYTTTEFKIRDEEDLLLLDNSNDQLWTVRNARGMEGSVPPLAVVIPGPTKEAIEAAVRMRLQLLAAWTNALKTIGRRLIVLMLLVFKAHYEDDELKVIKSIGVMDRQDLLRILDYIESTLKTHWADHEGFQNLQERILMLRMILEQADDSLLQDPEKYKALIVQITTLEELMKRYQEMWREWEKYKVALETSRAPELMLICEKWEQLKFVTRASFARFWQNELPFTEEEKRMLGLQHLAIEGALTNGHAELDEVDESMVKTTALNTAAVMNGMSEEGMHEEGVIEETTGFEQVKAARAVSDSSEFGFATETKTAQTEQLSSVEGEESKRFVISSVVDPRTKEAISLDDAILAGIIKPDEGIYCDLTTGDVTPIPVAMTAGLINVVFSTTKRAREKRSSVGIITVKTIRMPSRPYTIISAKDTRTGKSLSKEEALESGIINAQLGVFIDSLTGKEMLIVDAFEKGLMEIEYDEQIFEEEEEEAEGAEDVFGPKPVPEVEACAYAIRAVVDRKNRKTISFQDAVAKGIIDKDSGAYYDNLNDTTMYIGDAIMRGFLKARVLDDPNTMDIDPENKLIVDKTERIKKKMMNPLAIINALKGGLKAQSSVDSNENFVVEED